MAERINQQLEEDLEVGKVIDGMVDGNERIDGKGGRLVVKGGVSPVIREIRMLKDFSRSVKGIRCI